MSDETASNEEPEGLRHLRAMAALAGESILSMRRLNTGRATVAARWSSGDITWTWTLEEGLQQRTPNELAAWRPGYEPFRFHTDEQWAEIEQRNRSESVSRSWPDYRNGIPLPRSSHSDALPLLHRGIRR